MNTDSMKRATAMRIGKPKSAPKANPRSWAHMTKAERAECIRNARRNTRRIERAIVGGW
jgi:hypothetical protein